LITSLIDAKENRDVMIADVPNAFVQTEMDNKTDKHKVAMKIRGQLVDMLIEIDHDKYEPFVRKHGNEKFYT
jgi:hypothetical protein